MGTRRLREVREVCQADRKKTMTINFLRFNAKLEIRVVVSNTDQATGIDDETLTLKRIQKGCGDRSRRAGQPIDLFNGLEELSNVVQIVTAKTPSGRVITWCFCVYSEGRSPRRDCRSGRRRVRLLHGIS